MAQTRAELKPRRVDFSAWGGEAGWRASCCTGRDAPQLVKATVVITLRVMLTPKASRASREA
ncbi:MAG TPA: hypothetical protein VJ783_05550 [Pirellulales bacterium]|nr:hypothetical protein [Pirellulales bacterium]